MATLSPVKPLAHTGPRHPVRIKSVPSMTSVVRAELPPGSLLSDSLVRLLDGTGCTSASAEIFGGSFGRLSHVIPAVCQDGTKPVTFSEPRDSPGPSHLLVGSATVGLRNAQPFTHCHATWVDADGTLRGGHLMPDVEVGDVPIQATLRVLHDAEQHSDIDPETRMPVFTPSRRTAAPASKEPRARAAVSRVRPGVDLHAAVAEIGRRHGFSSAVVRGSLGSVVGARLHHRTQVVEVDAPATELTSLIGTAHGLGGEDPTITLSCTLVDVHGSTHSGVLVEGENLVAVTFELYVEEDTAHG